MLITSLNEFATGVNGDDDLPDVAMQAEPIQVSDAAEEKPGRFTTEAAILYLAHLLLLPHVPAENQCLR